MLKRRDEQGSLVVALAVIMILSALAIGGMARTLATLRAARATQDFNANLTNADSAVSDVLFRLDQGATGQLDSAAGETRFRYHATPVPSPVGVDTYDVKAVGTLNGRPHGIQTTLQRRRRFPYALYARHDINLSGGGTPGICGTVDPVSSVYFPALIGASGTITLPPGDPLGPAQPTPTSSTAPCQASRGGDGQDSYAPSGVCVACYGTAVYRSPDRQTQLDPSLAPVLADITSAPSGALSLCSFSGAIAAGTYVCTGTLTFTGDATVLQTGPPVIIYQLGGGVLQLAQRSINYPSAGPGDSGQLQIYKGGTGTISIGSSGTAQLSAVVHAPLSTLTGDGQTFHFGGSMVLDNYTYNGQPDFTFAYNRGAASVTRDWTALNYHEIPANQVP